MITVIQLFASLTLLVLIHEFGHFLFARIFKIRVEKFYMFFNPFFTLFKFKPKNSDTEYGVGWLPLGGYVKIAGMIDESLDVEQMSKPAQPWEFRSHPAWHRLLVMVGGVLFNFILALAIYSGLSYVYGDKYLPIQSAKYGMQFGETAHRAGFVDGDILLKADSSSLVTFDDKTIRQVIEAKYVTVLRDGREVSIAMPFDFMQQLMRDNDRFAFYRFPFIVDALIDNSPAQAAGLMANDTVLAVNGRPMYYMDICTTIQNNASKSVNLTVLRGADTLNVDMIPDAQGHIGVYTKRLSDIFPFVTNTYSLVESVPAGIKKAVGTLASYVGDLKYLFTKEGATSVGGFGSIAQLYPSFFNFEIFWNMTAFLSIILAFMNFLPIPALDGGHIMFLVYEIVTGRKPSQKFLVKAQTIGMVLLLALMLYSNLNDLFKFLF